MDKPVVDVDPVGSARAAGLHYGTDRRPGIRRRGAGRGFAYHGPDGNLIRDPETLQRIRSLAIPPAWTDVWICPNPRGHLQATGRDARGRKQYRYHSRWREVRDEAKYDRMVAFGRALPKIRARVAEDLSLPGLPRDRVLATVVRLLEASLIRVGNDEYARENESFGLTTMRDRHAKVEGSTIVFEFRGKSGRDHQVEVEDPRLARIVKRCQDIPGYELFQYIDDDGEREDVGSTDVNEYLKEVSGEPFTAKDFRTWAGTVAAAELLQAVGAIDDSAAAKRSLTEAIEKVAKQLGNTPTICRKCYVHPAVIESFLDGTLGTLESRAKAELKKALRGSSDLKPNEVAVLTLLQQRLAREIKDRDRPRTKTRMAS